MKKFLLTVVSLIAFSAGAMAQKPALNLMGEKPVDPRMEEYRKAVDREYNDALKKVPERRIMIPGRVSVAMSQPRSEKSEVSA